MIIVNLNRKGGVGKTTNTIHISSVLATMGHKVLLVDADNQCDLSGGCKVRGEELETIYNIVDFLEDNPEDKEEILTEVEKNMFLLAGSKYFDAQKYERTALKKTLKPLKEAFDFIFIDVPPAEIIATSITPAELALFASDYSAPCSIPRPSLPATGWPPPPRTPWWSVVWPWPWHTRGSR